MKSYPYICFITGLLVILCYLAFSLLAYSRYLLPFLPMKN